MADKPNAQKAGALRARKDIPKTVRTPREKVTFADAASTMETAPEWSVENVASQMAAVQYVPAVGETRVVPVHTPLPPRGFEAVIVSALVSLAKFARRQPGTALGLAAAAGLAAGLCARRI
ncbi:MAG TPA: hypothetical protein VF283_12710 [Bryobacteraceae bacterium]